MSYFKCESYFTTYHVNVYFGGISEAGDGAQPLFNCVLAIQCAAIWYGFLDRHYSPSESLDPARTI